MALFPHPRLPLLLFPVLVVACGGTVSSPSPNATSSAAPSPNATRPARCATATNTPTRFVGGAPANVSTSSSSSPSPGVTYTAVDGFAVELARDDTNLYWTLVSFHDGTIISAPLRAGDPVVVVDERGEGLPNHLTVNGGRLWWLETNTSDASQGRIMTAALDGSALRAVTEYEAINDVAFDDSAAYVMEWPSILRIDLNTGAHAPLTASLSGGPAAPGGDQGSIAINAGTGSIAVDDANVYVLTLDALSIIPKNGGAITAIPMPKSDSLNVAGGIATDGATVYWSLDNGSAPHPHMFAMPGGAGATVDLGELPYTATMLHPQGAWLYFMMSGAIYRMPAKGGAPSAVTPSMNTQIPPQDYSSGLGDGWYSGSLSNGAVALDGTNVYWGAMGDDLAPTVFCAVASDK
jgi:hypothetical protein